MSDARALQASCNMRQDDARSTSHADVYRHREALRLARDSRATR